MNLNLITYSIYILITVFIIIKVGLICYKNGNIFVAHLVPDDKDFCLRINNMLLIGYYLINIGYTVITLSEWTTIYSISQMVESLSKHTAIIICILAILHYFNLFWITKFIKNIK
ncbi:hypothetical protein [uncultured Aquimarina sp.]|uniref:hypothetical protein n=1 Tax=uncultured Aquimarina sp. TaxID=575652 RepID=UPI00262576AF|nr:hypothetical protein [uncultured Aquimarina sp.]